MKKKNILFVCKYNRFRSKIAEACFKKFNKNKNFQGKSAGIIKGRPLNKSQQALAKKLKIVIKGPTQGLSSKLLRGSDIIVIVADDVPKEVFKFQGKYLQKIIVWKIEDKNSSIELIIKKVKDLINKLEKQK